MREIKHQYIKANTNYNTDDRINQSNKLNLVFALYNNAQMPNISYHNNEIHHKKIIYNNISIINLSVYH